MASRLIINTLLVAGISLCTAVIAWFGYLETRPDAPPVVITGAADVGGDFSLTDPDGRTVRRADFAGRTIILYFGWASDPDLTPAALQVLSAAVERIGPKSDRFALIFISLDGARDEPQKLRDFIGKLDRRLTALRGSDADIAALARAYKLYFKRLPDASLPGGYSLDHASLYYVLGEDGGFRGIVPHTTDAAALAQDILKLVK